MYTPSEKEDLGMTILAPFTSVSTISKVLNLPYGVVRRFVGELMRDGRSVNADGYSLTETQAKELLDTGGLRTVVDKFFSRNSNRKPWSLPELTFLEDNVGVLTDYEVAYWLGRTEKAVGKKRRQLGLDHLEASGYLTTEDVMECSGKSRIEVSRDKKAGLLVPENQGEVRKTLEFKVGKLRYNMKSLTRRGEKVTVRELPRLLKGKKFRHDFYTFESLDVYLEKANIKETRCVTCSKPARGFSQCATCRA